MEGFEVIAYDPAPSREVTSPPGPSGLVLDLLPFGLYVCDREGLIVSCNRRAVELWGRTPKLFDFSERFSGAFRLYRLDGGPLDNCACPVAEVLSTGEPVRGQELVIERPDGSQIVARVDIDALTDESGGIAGAVSCFRDITAERRSQSRPRETGRQYQEILEALPAAVYMTDAEGRITFYNKAAAELWGCRPELGKSAFCGSWKLFRPDGTPMAHDECPMALALKEKRPITGVDAIAERPDGSRVPFTPYPVPLFDDCGNLTGGVNMLVDISGRQRGEAAADRLAAIIESSDDAILAKDLDGVITSWNNGAERLFGYTEEEVIGKPVLILFPPERYPEEDEILHRIRRGERIEHYETVRRRKDGSLVEISLTVSPVKDAQGRIAGASKIARDITERKRAEEQQHLLLREMNHRVKNLFTLAASLVVLSARNAKTPQALAKSVQERLTALARAHELTLTKPAGDAPLSRSGTTLHALIDTILLPFENGEEAGKRVAIEGPDIRVEGSAVTSLGLLLHELATNAAKYGALSVPSGRIAIECSQNDGYFILDWTETGGPSAEPRLEGNGFGSLLLRSAARHQLGGDFTCDWRPEGLAIHLRFAIERLAA